MAQLKILVGASAWHESSFEFADAVVIKARNKVKLNKYFMGVVPSFVFSFQFSFVNKVKRSVCRIAQLLNELKVLFKFNVHYKCTRIEV